MLAKTSLFRIAFALIALVIIVAPALNVIGQNLNDITTGPYAQIDVENNVLRWRLEGSRLIVEPCARGVTSPIVGPVKCTELKKPCPTRKSSETVVFGDITFIGSSIGLYNGWSLSSKPAMAMVAHSTTYSGGWRFELKGPKDGEVEILGCDLTTQVRPDLKARPWGTAKWSWEVSLVDEDVAFFVPTANLINHKIIGKDSGPQGSDEIASGEDACWVEVPCPKSEQ